MALRDVIVAAITCTFIDSMGIRGIDLALSGSGRTQTPNYSRQQRQAQNRERLTTAKKMDYCVIVANAPFLGEKCNLLGKRT